MKRARGPLTGEAARVKEWIRSETRLGRRAVRPMLTLGLLQVVLALAQAWCVASVLGALVAGTAVPAWPLAGFGVAALARAGLQFVLGVRAASAGAGARRRLRSAALGRILDHAPGSSRASTQGDLATLLVDEVEGVDGFYARWLPAAQLAQAAPILVLAIVLPIDPFAALVLLAGGIAVPLMQAVFGVGAAAASRRQFAALARLQVRFVDRVRGIATIVLSGAVEEEARALAAAADELRARTMRILRVAFLSSAALDCALVASVVVIAIADRHALLDHPTARGAARALFALIVVPEFFAPLRNFALAYQDKNRIVGAAERLGAPVAETRPVPAPAIRHVQAHGVTVAFEDVSFAWEGRGPILRHLNFRVPAGETAVLVGPSGSGKSTVIELLLGFEAPQSGRITINGAELGTIVPQALSRMTSWIGQRPVLFAGSMRENIRFARPDASEAELADAVRAARLDELVEALPDGLETMLGEGGYGLSGGQAQRVAVARAFLRNAPLLLLDEPTAHLDPATEGELLESLRRLSLNRTVIMASHSSAAHVFAGRKIELGMAETREVVA